jgi:hypothetical protein
MVNLAKAIIAVMNEVKGMEKNSLVGAGQNSYNGTKDQDVKEVFNDAMFKHGLCILPIGIEDTVQVDRWEGVDPWSKSTPKDNKMYQSVFTTVKTKYLLLHESGESQELTGYGHGVDPQDKGAGKATTYALKNCLLYTFLTPVGKIDDTDKTHSDDIQTPTKKAAPKQDAPAKSELIPLLEGSSNWLNCVKALKDGFSLNDFKRKYSFTDQLGEKLVQQSSL